MTGGENLSTPVMTLPLFKSISKHDVFLLLLFFGVFIFS